MLPTEKHQPKPELRKLTFQFYGRPKIGKTSLAAQFPDALIVSLEPGAEFLEVYKQNIKNWTELKELTKEILASDRFSTIVWDTSDRAYAMCDKYVCTQLKVKSLEELDWGVGFKAARKEFTSEVDRIRGSGRGMIFTSHQAVENYTDYAGRKKQRICPSLKDKGAQVIDTIVDVWAPLLDGEDGKRILRLRGDDKVLAGHRLNLKYFPGLKDVDEIDLGKSPEEAYQALVKVLFPNGGEK